MRFQPISAPLSGQCPQTRRPIRSSPGAERMPTTSACIGLGRMGAPMSRNLAKAGYELVVFDVSPAATKTAAEYASTVAASAREAASLADAVLISVPGPQEDEDVLLGAN